MGPRHASLSAPPAIRRSIHRPAVARRPAPYRRSEQVRTKWQTSYSGTCTSPNTSKSSSHHDPPECTTLLGQRSPQHGDLWPSNVVHSGGSWWLLDFEVFGEVQVPLYDVCHFVRT